MNLKEKLQMKGHTWGNNAKALKAMVRMYKVSKEAAGKEEEEQQKMMQKDMATFLEGAWYVSVVDVEATLRHVCKKVLTDTSIDKPMRKRRAIALKKLGEVFLAASSGEQGKNADGTTKSLRERLQEMMPPEMSAAAAAAGGAGGSGAADEDDDDADFEDLDAPDAPAGWGTAGAWSAFHGGPPGGQGGAVSREVLQAMSVKELRAVISAQVMALSSCLVLPSSALLFTSSRLFIFSPLPPRLVGSPPRLLSMCAGPRRLGLARKVRVR